LVDQLSSRNWKVLHGLPFVIRFVILCWSGFGKGMLTMC
jgi:hypothetical protein